MMLRYAADDLELGAPGRERVKYAIATGMEPVAARVNRHPPPVDLVVNPFALKAPAVAVAVDAIPVAFPELEISLTSTHTHAQISVHGS